LHPNSPFSGILLWKGGTIMLKLGETMVRNCQGLTRREMLQVAGLGLSGSAWPDWLRSQQSLAAGPREGRRGDVSCIFLWLDGGPSHFETFDPKPSAPDTVRGPYGVIDTNVPGIRICELLPTLAQYMDQCCLIRSMSH